MSLKNSQFQYDIVQNMRDSPAENKGRNPANSIQKVQTSLSLKEKQLKLKQLEAEALQLTIEIEQQQMWLNQPERVDFSEKESVDQFTKDYMDQSVSVDKENTKTVLLGYDSEKKVKVQEKNSKFKNKDSHQKIEEEFSESESSSGLSDPQITFLISKRSNMIKETEDVNKRIEKLKRERKEKKRLEEMRRIEMEQRKNQERKEQRMKEVKQLLEGLLKLEMEEKGLIHSMSRVKKKVKTVSSDEEDFELTPEQIKNHMKSQLKDHRHHANPVYTNRKVNRENSSASRSPDAIAIGQLRQNKSGDNHQSKQKVKIEGQKTENVVNVKDIFRELTKNNVMIDFMDRGITTDLQKYLSSMIQDEVKRSIQSINNSNKDVSHQEVMSKFQSPFGFDNSQQSKKYREDKRKDEFVFSGAKGSGDQQKDLRWGRDQSNGQEFVYRGKLGLDLGKEKRGQRIEQIEQFNDSSEMETTKEATQNFELAFQHPIFSNLRQINTNKKSRSPIIKKKSSKIEKRPRNDLNSDGQEFSDYSGIENNLLVTNSCQSADYRSRSSTLSIKKEKKSKKHKKSDLKKKIKTEDRKSGNKPNRRDYSDTSEEMYTKERHVKKIDDKKNNNKQSDRRPKEHIKPSIPKHSSQTYNDQNKEQSISSRSFIVRTDHPRFVEFKSVFPGVEDHLISEFLEKNRNVKDVNELYDRFVDKHFNDI